MLKNYLKYIYIYIYIYIRTNFWQQDSSTPAVMWSSHIQAEILFRKLEQLSLPRRIKSGHRKYLGTLVIL
jgi:hypothetical protein